MTTDLKSAWIDAQATRFTADGQILSIKPSFGPAADPSNEATADPAIHLDKPVI